MTACCPIASARGVRPGLTVAHARALLPGAGAIDAPHDHAGQERALDRLARWALRFAPFVCADPPDGLLLDATGATHLFGGPRRMADAMVARLKRLGFAAQVAAAPTIGAAWAMARYGPQSELPALPVESLRLDPAVSAALREVGVERIGDVLALPRATLPARFPGLLQRLDQATGAVPEVIDALHPVPPPRASCAFAGPVRDPRGIDLAARRLLETLAGRLLELERGARQLELVLERLDAPPLTVTVDLSRPSRDLRHLWALLRPRLERVDLTDGIERMSLTARRPGRLPHGQGHFAGQGESAPDVERLGSEFIDTLVSRLGADRVLRARAVASHVPERGYALEKPPGDFFAAKKSPGDFSDRPGLLLQRPEPIEAIAMTPEGPPRWLRWRGAERRIVTAAGPERIACTWWEHDWAGAMKQRKDAGKGRREAYARAYAEFMLRREPGDDVQATPVAPAPRRWVASPSHRDYFKVQDERGCWLWVFRDRASARWFMHGVWA